MFIGTLFSSCFHPGEGAAGIGTITLRHYDSTFVITPVEANGKARLHADVYVNSVKVLANEWKLRYPLYKLAKGDMDHDGREDIFAGVINRTRFDTALGKRIFIFKMYEGYIRPLWLGSHVSQPLEDFEFLNGNLRTIEHEHDGNFLVAEYRWKGFGLEFVNYLQRHISLEKSKTYLLQ